MSGILPTEGHEAKCIGRIGVKLAVEAGRQAAHLAALNALAVARQQLGPLACVTQIVRLGVPVATAGDVRDQSEGAVAVSELLVLLMSSCRLTSFCPGVTILSRVMLPKKYSAHRLPHLRARLSSSHGPTHYPSSQALFHLVSLWVPMRLLDLNHLLCLGYFFDEEARSIDSSRIVQADQRAQKRCEPPIA